ncbi:MAG: mechanosensitive ion channel [Eubacteriales bacterium]|nr:mechanosensitive ion channel [Eubacteriales bacterium]
MAKIFKDGFLAKLDGEVILEKSLTALIILIVGYIFIRLVIMLERRAMKRSPIDPVNYVLVTRSTRIVLWLILVVSILPVLGISTAPIIAAMGTAGVAISLALRDSLSNVASGIIMVFTKPFTKGDVIQIDGITGVVDFIDILSTKLHTFDNNVVIVPNKQITNSILTNITKLDVHRVDLTFGISYDSDIDKAKSILREIIHDNEVFLEEPEPVIGVNELGDSAVMIACYVWCKTESRFNAAYFFREEAKKKFEEAGISIPFTTLDVNVSNVIDNK